MKCFCVCVCVCVFVVVFVFCFVVLFFVLLFFVCLFVLFCFVLFCFVFLVLFLVFVINACRVHLAEKLHTLIATHNCASFSVRLLIAQNMLSWMLRQLYISMIRTVYCYFKSPSEEAEQDRIHNECKHKYVFLISPC